ncbi:MAG: aminoacyl-tRNA hydrolase [Lachnospiraceae bacterium]|nr:aminoacyl-tRNA hydrolase [Lachnospiraceae bacterium]
MYIVAGLGNPGLKYRHTRHNAGFDVIDVLADQYGIAVKESKHKALIGKGVIDGQQVMLVKPQTFMNLSGESLINIVNFYKLDPTEDVIVISDDVTLDPGNIRVRRKGSAGGHNGLKNIIEHFHTDQFLRVRVGVGKLPTGGDMIAHVLGRPPKDDRAEIEKAYDMAADAVRCIMNQGVEEAMNSFNGKKA